MFYDRVWSDIKIWESKKNLFMEIKKLESGLEYKTGIE